MSPLRSAGEPLPGSDFIDTDDHNPAHVHTTEPHIEVSQDRTDEPFIRDADRSPGLKVQLQGAEDCLQWENEDRELQFPELMEKSFGIREWMRQLVACLNRRRTSPAKAAASRENGKKGGQTRKQHPVTTPLTGSSASIPKSPCPSDRPFPA
jgi:hypothetical protein